MQQDRQQQADDNDEASGQHLCVAAREIGIGEEQQHENEHHIEIDRDAGNAADLHLRVHRAPFQSAHRCRPAAGA